MKYLFAILIFVLVNQAYALEAEHSPELEKLFKEAGVNGTFVLFDVAADRLVIHNQQRAEKRFIPASTFKIANSLIGLSTGAVASVDEVLPYGGKPQPFKAWEQDMSLRDAIKVSNVPVYQELARRIGRHRQQWKLEESLHEELRVRRRGVVDAQERSTLRISTSDSGRSTPPLDRLPPSSDS